MVNMSRLFNKVAIVTGASKGIGGGIATALGAAGARVAVNYSSDRAERVAQAITDNGGEAIAVGADVSKAADVARLFKEVDSAFGRLDVLGQQRRGIPLRRFRGDHRRELSPPLRHQRSRGDSHRAGGDQAVRCRRREHHQP
jgi:short chain dehydrogenase